MEDLTQNEVQSVDTVQITLSVKQEMLSSAKWGRFLAIVGFVVTGLMLLMAIWYSCKLSSIGTLDMDDDMVGLSAIAATGITSVTFSFVISAIVSFIFSFFLFKASVGTIRGLNSNDQLSFAQGIHNLKILTTISGIITAIGTTIMVLSMLFILLVGVAM